MTPADLTVRDVMEAFPALVGADCPLRDVLTQMNERRIGSVLVVRDGRQLCGIFTERDLLRRVAIAPVVVTTGRMAHRISSRREIS